MLITISRYMRSFCSSCDHLVPQPDCARSCQIGWSRAEIPTGKQIRSLEIRWWLMLSHLW